MGTAENSDATVEELLLVMEKAHKAASAVLDAHGYSLTGPTWVASEQERDQALRELRSVAETLARYR